MFPLEDKIWSVLTALKYNVGTQTVSFDEQYDYSSRPRLSPAKVQQLPGLWDEQQSTLKDSWKKGITDVGRTVKLQRLPKNHRPWWSFKWHLVLNFRLVPWPALLKDIESISCNVMKEALAQHHAKSSCFWNHSNYGWLECICIQQTNFWISMQPGKMEWCISKRVEPQCGQACVGKSPHNEMSPATTYREALGKGKTEGSWKLIRYR